MLRPLILITSLLLLPTAYASDDEAGGELHQQHCVRCHDSSIYRRAAPMVTNLEALESQVQRCEQMLALRWFDEDIENVSGYLNHHYYHFDD